MSNISIFRCKKCLLIPTIIKTFFDFYNELECNKLIIQCPNNHIEKKTLEEFISENRISLKNISCKKCEKNICSYYCTKCYKTICDECYNKNKNNKILLKDIDVICYLHYQKYILKCGKCKLLICSKCIPEHIDHEKNNIYFNFYLKKFRGHIKSYHKYLKKKEKEKNKNSIEYYKFKEIFFKDYEIFDKNKIYNNAIINNYNIFRSYEKNYSCANINIDYTSQNSLEQNLIHKINDEKHFYTSNPMLIKLNNYSYAKKSIDYTLLDNIIYNNNNNENILVYSILSMEDDKYVNDKIIPNNNLKDYCYLVLKNIDTNKYIFKQISLVKYEKPKCYKYSERFIYFEKYLKNFKINYLIERTKTQIAIFDLNELKYIYYNNNIENNNRTKIIYKDSIFYLCVVFNTKITLINIKTKQITSVIKYEKYINNVFKIKNAYYIITENISYNFYTNKKINNYDVFTWYPYDLFIEGVIYFNYKKKDTLIFYLETNASICCAYLILADFFSGEKINIFDTNDYNLLIYNTIFWNSNFIFLFFEGPWLGSEGEFRCKVFDIFREEEKYIIKIEDSQNANMVMKYFNQNLGEIVLYSYRNNGEIYIYKCSEQKNETLISKDEIMGLIYPLRKKRREEEEERKKLEEDLFLNDLGTLF